jgi:RimJ/RimL family protein N-acetyltransferase
MKLHRVELNTWSDNKRAIRCYEKCGFRIEGILREAVFCIILGILDREFEEM